MLIKNPGEKETIDLKFITTEVQKEFGAFGILILF